MTERDNLAEKCTEEELKILLCVAKGRQSLGHSMIVDVLTGSHSVRVFSRRLYLNSTFGALKHCAAEDIEKMIRGLVDEGLLTETEDEYPRLQLSEAAKELLHEELVEELD